MPGQPQRTRTFSCHANVMVFPLNTENAAVTNCDAKLVFLGICGMSNHWCRTSAARPSFRPLIATKQR